ncbi:MAG TPA: DUF3017 domain-containing protein [Nocardioidaceae bacterium]|nr:DUF3017 domain-containing protein [Nocardioidaceae bacterium]
MNQLPEPELRPDEPRRYPSTIGGLCYIIVGVTAAVGLAIVVLGDFRTGLSVMGGGLLGGAACRLILPDHKAGMLKVRRKSLDVVFLTILGVGLLTLAIVVPDAV